MREGVEQKMENRVAPTPASAAQVEAVGELLLATHRAQTDLRRRVAALAAVVAVVFGVLGMLSTLEWLDLRDEVAGVQDRTLVEGFGMEIPDPRPALERGVLRVRALIFAITAIVTLSVSAVAAALYALIRPRRLPDGVVTAIRGPSP